MGVVVFCSYIIILFLLDQESANMQTLNQFLLPCLVAIGFFGMIFFFGVVISEYLIKKKDYAKTEYRIFSTRVEIHNAFLGVSQKTVDYQSIIEISLRQGWIQKKFGLGDLVLSTPATVPEYMASLGGFALTDLENPDHIYQQVRGIWSQRVAG